MENAKTALEQAFMGVLSKDESFDMVDDYDEEQCVKITMY